MSASSPPELLHSIVITIYKPGTMPPGRDFQVQGMPKSLQVALGICFDLIRALVDHHMGMAKLSIPPGILPIGGLKGGKH